MPHFERPRLRHTLTVSKFTDRRSRTGKPPLEGGVPYIDEGWWALYRRRVVGLISTKGGGPYMYIDDQQGGGPYMYIDDQQGGGTYIDDVMHSSLYFLPLSVIYRPDTSRINEGI